MEGVGRDKVKLMPHNGDWGKEFLSAKAEIEAVWTSNLIDIQHVGSTSINGICAKPILDIAVRLESIEAMDVEAMRRLGYEYRGPQHGNDGYHLFVLRSKEQLSLRHIHCYSKDEPEFMQLTGFRDFLNAHPETAEQYQNLKIRLAELYPNDRVAYTKGKEEFILNIYSKFDAGSNKISEDSPTSTGGGMTHQKQA